MKLEFRTLKADEIECRVGQCKENGCTLLLYQDSRCAMTLLDEVVGAMNWQREHNFKDGKLYCKISIYDETKNCWVSKEDVGVESNTEEVKGQSSDSFKRASVNWGIGRELYSSPFIWIPLETNEVITGNGKPKLSSKVSFSVSNIKYDNQRNIIGLVIKDNKGKERFSFEAKKVKEEVIPQPVAEPIINEPIDLEGLDTPKPPLNLLDKWELDIIAKNKSLTAMMKDFLGGIKYSEATADIKNAIARTMRVEMKQRGLIL